MVNVYHDIVQQHYCASGGSIVPTTSPSTSTAQQNPPVITCLLIIHRYYAQLFLSQLVVTSPELISRRTLERIKAHMEDFIRFAMIHSIVKYEEKANLRQTNMKPLVRLAYGPNKSRSVPPRLLDPNASLIKRLQDMAMESAVFALSCLMTHSEMRDLMFFARDDLLGYVVCLPWTTPYLYKDKACRLVTTLATHRPIQPPKLATIARAKMAKTHFGLENAMKPADEIQRILRPTASAPPAQVGSSTPQLAPPKSLVYIIAIQ